MDKTRKLELLQRALGLKHKLKVHDSMPMPETHEQIALATWGRWELEDELRAIEQLLEEARDSSISDKKKIIAKEGIPKKKKK